jgi:RimJ/RimL family protein N-acetyltransferase
MLQRGLLKGTNVYLDAMRESDLEIVTAWYGSTDFLRHLDAVPAAPQLNSQIQEWYKQRAKQTNGFLFAVRHLADDRLLGYVELDSILWSHQVSWIVIAIGEADDRGRGFGRDALNTLVRFAFHELNLRRLQLTVFAYNKGAIHLYESLGFQREGTFREFLHRDGSFHDMYLYGLLRQEWVENGA